MDYKFYDASAIYNRCLINGIKISFATCEKIAELINS